MTYTCKVCGDKFEDGWDHALTGKGLLSPKDKAHAEALDKFREQLYKGDCPLCGCEVRIWGHSSPDGDASWEIACVGCGFLYDED